MKGWTNEQIIVAYNHAVEGYPWLLGEVQLLKNIHGMVQLGRQLWFGETTNEVLVVFGDLL
jgi:hypothetical protein